MIADTPSFPLPPIPTGHATVLPTLVVDPPSAVTQAGLVCVRKSVKMFVVPDPSERWAMAMGVLGSVVPGFRALMAGSFHTVMPPEKILPRVAPSNLRPLAIPGRLYATTTGACTSGICTPGPPFALAMSESFMKASESPKWTVFARSCAMPAPEPTDEYATWTLLEVAYAFVQTDIIGATNVE